MIGKPRAPRIHWDVEKGWVVDSQISLNRRQLHAIVKHTKKIQSERILAMAPGDKKEQATAALKALTVGAIRVNLLPESGFSQGERELYLNRG